MRYTSFAVVLGLFWGTQGVYANSDNTSIRVIVKYKQQHHSIASLKKQIARSVHSVVRELTPMANGAYSLIVSPSKSSLSKKKEESTDLILQQLRANPDVAYAVKDRVGHFKPVPEPALNNDLTLLLSHENQWDEFSRPAGVMLESHAGLSDGAWAYTRGAAQHDVVIAVLDTGVALNEHLVNNLVKDRKGQVWGWNFSGNNNDLADETDSYHGTHVAGTIAGYGSVVRGMGEDLKILTVKIPGKEGLFYESAVINGIYWSVGASVPGVPQNIHPAKVLNMSFSVDLEPGREIDYCDAALQEAIFFARKQGAVLVAAAGNDNLWDHLGAPAVCNGTLKIASTGPEGLRSYFSNHGPSVSFAAPGGDKRYGVSGGILSTVNPGGGYNGSGFDFYQGTSMATPHVAGVAGLVYAVSDKSLSAEKMEQILYTTTHNFGQSDDDNKSCVGKKPCGHGILDAEYAVKAALANYDVLFSAPKLSERLACTVGMEERLYSGDAVWLKKEGGCAPGLRYQSPHVEQDKDGAIYAYYGVARYQLEQSTYKECHIVGYDGIGCWR